MAYGTRTAAERQAACRNKATAGENGERRINTWVSTTWVSTGAVLALARLARHHGLTQRAMREHLIGVADDTITAELDPTSHAWEAQGWVEHRCLGGVWTVHPCAARSARSLAET